MSEKWRVTVQLDRDDPDEPPYYFKYDTGGVHTKLEFPLIHDDMAPLAIAKTFLDYHLPYINYNDLDPFQILDLEKDVIHARIFKYSDASLERELTVGHHIGIRNYHNEALVCTSPNYYLPGLPKLLYEEYPMFQPDVEGSFEYSNDQYNQRFLRKFNKVLKDSFQKVSSAQLKESLKSLDYLDYEEPVEYERYFTFNSNYFLKSFHRKIFLPIIKYYQEAIYHTEADLKGFFHSDEEPDDSYHPVLNTECTRTLKAIGSVAESSFPFGVVDPDTLFLNKLLVHVEIVTLSLGIGEGYELYFGTKKRNFNKPESKMIGSDFTKVDNFLKIFTKCVSICLNSKTNRFIITDYYWCAIFEIEDILDGEIHDVKRLISKVKVKHFSFYNFEEDPNLTIRNIIASFFYWNPTLFLEVSNRVEKLNKKVVNEWNEFQNNENYALSVTQKPPKKKLKRSPFIYRSLSNLAFTRQYVDLEKSMIRFIAIGYDWSCQTLSVDLTKLFRDKEYLKKVLDASDIDLRKLKNNHFLLSVYDEYYQDPRVSMMTRHLRNNNLKVGNTKNILIAESTYKRWLTNVEAYLKASSVQGDVIAKVVDYGYMEDRPYNSKHLHFKSDGFYVLYEPIGDDYLNDLVPVDTENKTHYQWAKASLAKLHNAGVSFYPGTSITTEVLKVHNNRVCFINLEECNTKVSDSDIKADAAELDIIFNMKEKSDKDRRSMFKAMLAKNAEAPLSGSMDYALKNTGPNAEYHHDGSDDEVY